MSVGSIDQFVVDNVPGRCRIASAVIEHAALRRGFEVTRTSQRVLIVRLDGAAVSFRDLCGPDSSLVGRYFGSVLDGQRCVLESRGIPDRKSVV